MQVIKLGDKLMTYFTLINIFSLEPHTYLDVRIQTRLESEMFRVTDGRIYNGYMKSDTPFALIVMEPSYWKLRIRVNKPETKTTQS